MMAPIISSLSADTASCTLAILAPNVLNTTFLTGRPGLELLLGLWPDYSPSGFPLNKSNKNAAVASGTSLS